VRPAGRGRRLRHRLLVLVAVAAGDAARSRNRHRRREAARLDTVLAEVKVFEDRKTTLQQRVSLIERLRQGQTVPVQLLDHVSRSLPDMLWLTDLRQEGPFLTIEGAPPRSSGSPISSATWGPIRCSRSRSRSWTAAPNLTQARAGRPDLIRFKVRASLNGLPTEGRQGQGQEGSEELTWR
jgi:hypothetical protein